MRVKNRTRKNLRAFISLRREEVDGSRLFVPWSAAKVLTFACGPASDHCGCKASYLLLPLVSRVKVCAERLLNERDARADRRIVAAEVVVQPREQLADSLCRLANSAGLGVSPLSRNCSPRKRNAGSCPSRSMSRPCMRRNAAAADAAGLRPSPRSCAWQAREVSFSATAA